MKNYSKAGLVTEQFPRKSVVIPCNERDLQFEIDNPGVWKPNKLYIRLGENQLVLDPKDYIGEEGNYIISTAQILPQTNKSYILYVGIEKGCCDGVFLSAKLSITPKAEPKITQVKCTKLQVHSNGILGSEEQVLVYGLCCNGSGIRRITLDDLCVHDDLYTTKEVRQDSGECYDVAHHLLLNPPHIRGDKLYISYLDAEGNILSNERTDPCVQQLEFMANDVRRRKIDLFLLSKIELCVDEKLGKIEKGSAICEDIKKAVKKSYFLYNYNLLPEVCLRGLSWAIYGRTMSSILGKLDNANPKAKA